MPRRVSAATYHTVTPFISCTKVGEVIDFLVAAFGAKERTRILGSRGRVAHAEVELGDSTILLGEPDPEIKRLKPMPSHHYIFVSNVEASYRRALAAGGTSFSKPIGPRLGAVTDPGGNLWWIAKREVAKPEVIEARHRRYLRKKEVA